MIIITKASECVRKVIILSNQRVVGQETEIFSAEEMAHYFISQGKGIYIVPFIEGYRVQYNSMLHGDEVYLAWEHTGSSSQVTLECHKHRVETNGYGGFETFNNLQHAIASLCSESVQST